MGPQHAGAGGSQLRTVEDLPGGQVSRGLKDLGFKAERVCPEFHSPDAKKRPLGFEYERVN